MQREEIEKMIKRQKEEVNKMFEMARQGDEEAVKMIEILDRMEKNAPKDWKTKRREEYRKQLEDTYGI